MRIAITTDSNSGITAQEAEKLGIFLLPMPVIIDEETYFLFFVSFSYMGNFMYFSIPCSSQYR